MNRKTRTDTNTNKPAESKANKASKAAKAKPRQQKNAEAQPEPLQEQQPFPSRPVQLHQIQGVCVVVVNPDELSATDPQIIERFRAAVESKSFVCLFSTETDVFDLQMMPFFFPADPKAADGKAQTGERASDDTPDESGESPLGR